jgi:hypothetical protein
VHSPQAYSGSSNWAFCIFAGRTTHENEEYNPWKWPWLIAASSGSKNVILILDNSESMNQFNQTGRLKAGAERIIDLLTFSDRVAVVEYSTHQWTKDRSRGQVCLPSNQGEQCYIVAGD